MAASVFGKKVEELLNKLMEIDEKPQIEQCVRVGTKRESTIRLVKFTFKITLHHHVQGILKLNSARKLRTKDGLGSI